MLYDFRCPKCGRQFEVSRPMSRAGEPAHCPNDGTPSERVYTMPLTFPPGADDGGPASAAPGGRPRPLARPQPRAGLAHALARSRRGDLQVATKRRSELEIAATLDADEADAPRQRLLLAHLDEDGDEPRYVAGEAQAGTPAAECGRGAGGAGLRRGGSPGGGHGQREAARWPLTRDKLLLRRPYALVDRLRDAPRQLDALRRGAGDGLPEVRRARLRRRADIIGLPVRNVFIRSSYLFW